MSDADDDGTVLMSFPTALRGSRERVYHSREDCPHVSEKAEAITRDELREGDRECEFCAGDGPVESWEPKPCPLCGRETGSLPNHLTGDCDSALAQADDSPLHERRGGEEGQDSRNPPVAPGAPERPE